MTPCHICSGSPYDQKAISRAIASARTWFNPIRSQVKDLDIQNENSQKFMMLIQALIETCDFAEISLSCTIAGKQVPARANARLAYDRAMTAGFALEDVYEWEKHGIAHEHYDRLDSDVRLSLDETNAFPPEILENWFGEKNPERPAPSFGPRNRHKENWYNPFAVNSAYVHFRLRPIEIYAGSMPHEHQNAVITVLHIALCSIREDINALRFEHNQTTLMW